MIIDKEILQVRILLTRRFCRRLKLRFPQELKQEADEIDLLLLGAAESGKSSSFSNSPNSKLS